MKKCNSCGLNFPTTEFFKDSSMTDGLMRRCKTCDKLRCAKRKPSEIRLASNAKRQRKYERKFPEKQRARMAVLNAINTGELKRQPCEKCGCKDVHGHHDDYSKPLKVRWLCQPHHVEAHYGKLPITKRHA